MSVLCRMRTSVSDEPSVSGSQIQGRGIRKGVVKSIHVENKLQVARGAALQNPILADHRLDYIGRWSPRKLRLPIDGARGPYTLGRCIQRRQLEVAKSVELIDPLVVQFPVLIEVNTRAVPQHIYPRVPVEENAA